MGKNLRISSNVRKPFLLYDFAPDTHLNFLIYEESFVFFFISAPSLAQYGLSLTLFMLLHSFYMI
jgi:hypothetical protein